MQVEIRNPVAWAFVARRNREISRWRHRRYVQRLLQSVRPWLRALAAAAAHNRAVRRARQEAVRLLVHCPIRGQDEYRSYLLTGESPTIYDDERVVWDKRIQRCRAYLRGRFKTLGLPNFNLIRRGRGQLRRVPTLRGFLLRGVPTEPVLPVRWRRGRGQAKVISAPVVPIPLPAPPAPPPPPLQAPSVLGAALDEEVVGPDRDWAPGPRRRPVPVSYAAQLLGRPLERELFERRLEVWDSRSAGSWRHRTVGPTVFTEPEPKPVEPTYRPFEAQRGWPARAASEALCPLPRGRWSPFDPQNDGESGS